LPAEHNVLEDGLQDHCNCCSNILVGNGKCGVCQGTKVPDIQRSRSPPQVGPSVPLTTNSDWFPAETG